MFEKSFRKTPSASKKSGAAIRVIFIGTPDFAVTALEELVASSGIEVVGVLTRPDHMVGRVQKSTPPPVKVCALAYGIPVFQPEKLRDPVVVATIRELKPDLAVIVVYGKIIPQEILDIPRYGVINIHPSLLPKYRGPSPTKAALLAGDKETGTTIMLVDAQMDHGSILAQTRVAIAPDETDETLFKKLASIGAQLLVETIPQWVYGEIRPQEQDHAQATYSKLLTRDDGRINWHEPAEVIERKIRAYVPWPGTWTIWDGKRLHILKARVTADEKEPVGTVKKVKEGFVVQCGSGALEVLELQLEGKKPMLTAAFLRGHPDIVGAKLQ